MDAVIIEVRCNEYTGREHNPHVPWTADEIAADAAACEAAGASVIHFHPRHADGSPATEPTAFAEAIRAIRASSGLLVNPTLGAATVPAAADRIAHIPVLASDPSTRPDFAPVDMGSFNIDPFDPVTGTFAVEDLVYATSVADLKMEIATIADAGAAVQAVLWNIGSARLVGAFAKIGVLSAPVYACVALSDRLLSAHPATEAGLRALIDALPVGLDVEWTVNAFGSDLRPLIPTILEAGGHVAIGLGDHHYDGRTNAEVVAEVAEMAAAAGRPVARPEDVRRRLG